jgi:hypothetical protein
VNVSTKEVLDDVAGAAFGDAETTALMSRLSNMVQ